MDQFFAVLHRSMGERVAAIGGARYCAVAGQNAADSFFGQFLGAFRPDEVVEAIANADDAHAVFLDRGANHTTDDGVEARRVACTIGDANRTYMIAELGHVTHDTQEGVAGKRERE